MKKNSVLDYLQKTLAGEDAECPPHMRYPTAISQTLAMRIVSAQSGEAEVEIDADPEKHGNQQGTIHGGLICELADAAIGTAHSTLTAAGESFATLEFKINFFRPVWRDVLRAHAAPMQNGKTITHYKCGISRADGKTVAVATSTVMTLRGDAARGR